MMNIKTALLAGGLGLLGMGVADACSVSFFTGKSTTGQEVLMTGRSADLSSEAIPNPPTQAIEIFPRGLAHDGNTVKGDLANPAKWTSKYGSLIADKFAEGVNEKGLCVHGLLQMDTVYQTPDGSTPCVSSFKLIIYLLDNAETVSECLDLLDGILVVEDKLSATTEGLGEAMTSMPVRYAIRDAQNDMAIVEFVNGGTKKKPVSKTVVYRGLDYCSATNEPIYAKHLKYYKKFSAGKKGLPGDYNALDRFVRLMMFNKTLTVGADTWTSVTNVFALMSTVYTIPGSVDYSMKEFEYVNKETNKGKKTYTHMWPTMWQSVTDLNNLVYYMRSKKLPGIFWIDLKKIDFETLRQTGKLLYTTDATLVGEANGKLTWE